MSLKSVEIVERAIAAVQEAVERDDPGAAFDAGGIAADLEWIPSAGFPGAKSYRGRDGFVEFMRTWTEDFEDWSFEVERLIEAPGDRIVVLAHQSATGKGSGAPVDVQMGQVFELEDGRIVRISNYLDPEEALEAAGLRE